MKRSLLRRTSAGSSLVALAALAAAACSSTPPPPPKPIAKPTPPLMVAAPAPLPPSRWASAGGATEVGPKLDAGMLVLVGGRRAIVGKDGSVKAETAPSPEPLEEVVEVPMPNGGRRLVARGHRGIYRLDDPLGAPKPLAQSEQDIRGIGAYMGLVAVWTFGADMPRFVDVETGRLKPVTTLPPLPLRSVAFRDAKEGAGLFDGVGLAVTADGGATWKRVTEDVKGDALRVFELAVRDGMIRAFVYDEGRDAPIDVAQARLGRLADHTPKDDDPALVKWIRATHRDPLAAAAASGVFLPDGSAIVASHGMVARVDTKTGMVTAAAEFARGDGLGACGMSRAGKNAWMACSLSEDMGGDRYDPFGVMRVSLEGSSLKPERPALIRSGEAELRTSPSGGVLLLGPCSSDDDGEVCARQPDGRWLTMRGEIDLFPRGAGPLSDGRIAFVRNLWEGDVPESERRDDEEAAREEEEEESEGSREGEGEGDHEDKPVPEHKRVYVAALGEGGKEERIATLDFRPIGELRVISAIEEDDEHTLSFVMADDDGVYAVSQPTGSGKEARKPHRIQGASSARIRGGRGIAVGDDAISASSDGGRTWQSVPLPESVRASLSDVTGLLDDPTVFSTSEVGMMLDRHVRIGWGTEEPREDRAEAPFDVTIPRAETSYGAGAERVLACNTEGPVQATAPLTSSSFIVQLLGKKGAPPKGTRRAQRAAPTARNGLMDVIALLEEEGPDKPGSEPAKWTLSWHDAAELGGKVRSWSGPPPKGTGWGTELRAAAGSGARALFTLRVGSSKNVLVRTKAGGGVETAEVGFDLLPSNEVVFGADKGEPIAWMRDTALVVWISGEAPRIIGHVAARSSRTLGEPTKDGVPVLLSSYDWSAMRVFPIPPPEKKGAPAPLPLAPTLEGWATVPNIRNQIGKLAPCAAKPKAGVRFFVTRGYARALVDGANGSLASALYDVRLAGNDACIAQVSTLYAPDRASVRPPPPPTTGKGAVPAKKGPITFVRADFLGKKAEGGDRGLPAKDQVFKLSCTLEDRK
ncbi:hypothetical protein [Polyangium jinanense]|uniref:Uncharacterized protein n=1 Tax=Polyangium jinanense TaxID=2829994 RepID=A0A9X3X3L7_9BACT|nr:hypothetical protein [Polyangium jinanense]MDC3962224.1 hypothetical protein [Polyangium jinanense]MDC3983622.1 hypothetical protein [Polyangium jinanense]